MSKAGYHYIKRILILLFFQTTALHLVAQQKTGTLQLRFMHTANNQPLVLRDSNYINPFGENYVVNKLKYYIGEISTGSSKIINDSTGYYLINAANEENTIDLKIEKGSYQFLEFLLGVDSTNNCSGAQTGALDPMNDMFWTWNSGYIFFKMEGSSDSSHADLQRIEYHIGGYKGNNNAARKIKLSMPKGENFRIRENAVTTLIIETNLDHFWKGTNNIKISEMAAWMSPGGFSLKAADNFQGLFSLKEISNQP